MNSFAFLPLAPNRRLPQALSFKLWAISPPHFRYPMPISRLLVFSHTFWFVILGAKCRLEMGKGTAIEDFLFYINSHSSDDTILGAPFIVFFFFFPRSVCESNDLMFCKLTSKK
jgi:hypothetical protein